MTRLVIADCRSILTIDTTVYKGVNAAGYHEYHSRSVSLSNRPSQYLIMSTETVLVVGATGNIGVSTVQAALRSKRNVLAIIRNQNSADKLIRHIGSSQGITLVEADVLSETGVRDVVEQVRAGKLPAFQHVYAAGEMPFLCRQTSHTDISSVGGEYVTVPLSETTPERLRINMKTTFETNYLAYLYTIDYLREQGSPTSWTICTGSQGDLATHPLPAMAQGALFSMSIASARENLETNVRFNEIYLGFRVEVDESAVQHPGVIKASEFGHVYETLLDKPEIRSSRVWVQTPEDIKELKYTRRF
ncbi:hypothetical protein BJX70DRAFT_149718 [Aspergillus crustosus]